MSNEFEQRVAIANTFMENISKTPTGSALTALKLLKGRIDRLECPHPDLLHFAQGHDNMHGQVSNVIDEMIKELL